MVLLDMKYKPTAVKSFECELISLENNPRTIKNKFEPVIIVRSIRQTCKIKGSVELQQYKDSVCNLLSRLEEKEEEEEELMNFKLKGMYFASSPSTSTLNSSNYNNNFTLNSMKTNKHSDRKDHRGGFELRKETPINVKFEFRNFPEFIEVGDTVVINEPYMKAFGCISKKDQT